MDGGVDVVGVVPDPGRHGHQVPDEGGHHAPEHGGVATNYVFIVHSHFELLHHHCKRDDTS